VAAELRFRTLSASPASSVWSGHLCGVTASGAGFCWGVDKTQLGREQATPTFCVSQNGLVGQPCSRDPVRVEIPTQLAAVASGDFHSCGLADDGTVWCWGSDSNGQLGSSADEACGEFALPCSFAPVRIASDRQFVQVVAGSIHACALAERGEAWCWGNNDDGQLGHSAPLGPHVPTEAAGGLVFISLSAGRRHTCGVTHSGEAYCWGANGGGQLGNGSRAQALTETRVKSGVRFVALSAGWSHTCALGADGAVYCWGSNVFGQLGNALTAPEVCGDAEACSTVPVRVGGASRRFIAVGAGGGHACALATAGAVYCWGDNSFGQLGDGGEGRSAVPVRVEGADARS
jgi:alpha-tubulin suppressor-like RCC1 family protein